jgi:hypothetical protein
VFTLPGPGLAATTGHSCLWAGLIATPFTATSLTGNRLIQQKGITVKTTKRLFWTAACALGLAGNGRTRLGGSAAQPHRTAHWAVSRPSV